MGVFLRFTQPEPYKQLWLLKYTWLNEIYYAVSHTPAGQVCL